MNFYFVRKTVDTVQTEPSILKVDICNADTAHIVYLKLEILEYTIFRKLDDGLLTYFLIHQAIQIEGGWVQPTVGVGQAKLPPSVAPTNN
jgi:hypothetical protein